MYLAIDRWTEGRLAEGTACPIPFVHGCADGGGGAMVERKVLDGHVRLGAVDDQWAGLVRDEVLVEPGDEIAVFPALLDAMDGPLGLVVTTDAIHGQDSQAHRLAARGAHYACTVEGNRRRLRAALAAQP